MVFLYVWWINAAESVLTNETWFRSLARCELKQNWDLTNNERQTSVTESGDYVFSICLVETEIVNTTEQEICQFQHNNSTMRTVTVQNVTKRLKVLCLRERIKRCFFVRGSIIDKNWTWKFVWSPIFTTNYNQ